MVKTCDEITHANALEAPDGLERMCAEFHTCETGWIEGSLDSCGVYSKPYKTVVLVGYRRTVAHLPFEKVNQSFTTSAAVAALWETLKSDGWQEV
jgi:hypothetical protein